MSRLLWLRGEMLVRTLRAALMLLDDGEEYWFPLSVAPDLEPYRPEEAQIIDFEVPLSFIVQKRWDHLISFAELNY